MFFGKFLTKSSTRNQYISAFAVIILTLSHGCAAGWLSPFIPYLKSSESHLTTGPVTSEDVSWIGSLLCIGGIIGTVSFGTIAEKLGKKNAMFLLVIPHLSFWCLVYFSTTAYHLYWARTLAGITGGGSLRTISIYITEISENEIRGFLGSFFAFALTSGFLVIFVAGTYGNFFVIPLVILILPIIYIISLLFIHDTPTSLLLRNKPDDAFKSLKFYRTCRNDEVAIKRAKTEFDILKKTLENKKDEKLSLSDFLKNPARKGLIIGMFLIFLNQFSGTYAIITYTADIFKSSGSSLSPNESSMIVAFIQLLGVYVSTLCVDRFGRKILMTISSIGTSIFLFVIATYSYLNESGWDLSKLSWLPIISLSLVIFLASLGIISLPFIIITELMPSKVRDAACTICMGSITTVAFFVLKIFPPLVKSVGLDSCMWFFSLVCFLGAIVTILFIPETKGKSLI